METNTKENNKSGTGAKMGTSTGSEVMQAGEIKTGEGKQNKESGKENSSGLRSNEKDSSSVKKRGRKKKESSEEVRIQKDQDKFFVDVSKDNEQRLLIQNFLNQANNKSYGREIILKDLVLIALPKLTTKDIEKIQENSLSEMERVQRALDEYNKKADLNLTLGEFLVKKLSLQ